MDATIEHAKLRASRIGAVERTLRAIPKDRDLDDGRFAIEIANDFVVSLRTAKEYIKVAKGRMEKEADDDGNEIKRP